MRHAGTDPRAPGGRTALSDARSAEAGPAGSRLEDLPLTKIQEDLLDRLPIYSANAAEAYVGALHVYYGRRYVDQPSHLAYALRDVVDHLIRERQDAAGKKMRLNMIDREDSLRRTFDPVTKRGYTCDKHYRALVEGYDRLSGIAHKRDPKDDMVPFDVMSRIERALHDLSFPQVMTRKMIDEMMSKPPTRNRARDLILTINTGAAQSRVINRLPIKWLASMDEEGFFRDPEKYRGGHRYLLRCAGKYPSRVAKIITRYDPEAVRGNDILYGDILDCALRMPAAHASSVSRFLIRAGLHDMFVHYPDRYLDLAAGISNGGKYDLAMEFARRGLSLDNIVHRYPGANWLDSPVQEFANATMAKAPLQLFELLADLLEDILTSGRIDHALPDDDSSMCVRCKTVEESDKSVTDLPSSLVWYMRSCLTIMGGDGARIRRAMGIMKRKRPLIYRRLEMFTCNTFPDTFGKEMEDYAVRYLDNPYTHHEHYVMLGNHYCSMSARAKARISEAIAGLAADGGTPGLDESDAASHEMRQLRYLECIKECLDGGQREVYEALVKKHHRGSDPEHIFTSEYGRMEPKPGPGPLEGKDPGQVLGIVRECGPENMAIPDMTMHGFSHLARANPGEFSRRAMELAGADPSAQARFFLSMRDALRDGKSIDWGGTIMLLEHVSEALAGGINRGEEAADAACSMLEHAFQHAPPGIEFRGGLRRAILSLVRTSTPERDLHLDDFEDIIKSGRPIDIINMLAGHLEGSSFIVMMMYALWCHDKTQSDRLVPEVKEILDKYVNGTRTIFRDAVLGSYLAHLYFFDKEWTINMIKEIRANTPLMIALWDGYMQQNCLYRDVFSDLRNVYVNFLTGPISKILKDRSTSKYTLVHCLYAYMYGYKGAGSVFENFLKSLRPNTGGDRISYLVSKVELLVHNIQDHDSFDVKRLERMWKHKVLSKQDLTYWFVKSKINSSESTRMYAEYICGYAGLPRPLQPILNELKLHANESPCHVLSALSRLLKIGEPHPSEAEIAREIREVLEKNPEVTEGDLEALDELLERAVSEA